MAVSGDLGSLFVSLELEIGKFRRGLDRAEQLAKRRNEQMSKAFRVTKNAVVALGTSFAALRLGRFVTDAINTADAIAKLGQQTGFSAEELQKYGFAAKLAGVEQANFNTGMQAFAKRLGELKAGTGGLLTFLNKYDQDLAAALANTTSTNEAFRLMADAFASIEDPATRAAFGAAAFSRSAGVELSNLLAQGTASLDEMGRQLEATGSLMSNESVKGAEAASDALDLLNQSTMRVITAFAVELAPSIATAANFIATNIPEAFAAARLAVSDFIELVLTFPDAVGKTIERTVDRVTDSMRELGGAVLDKAKGFFDGVTDAAADMYDAVVGRSWVPDMVEGIRASIGDLEDYMVRPVVDFTGTVIDTFENMARRIGDIFADVILGARSFGDALEGIGKSIVSDLVRGVTGAISGSVLGKLGFAGAGGAAAAGGGGILAGLGFGAAGTSAGAGGGIGAGFTSAGAGGGAAAPGLGLGGFAGPAIAAVALAGISKFGAARSAEEVWRDMFQKLVPVVTAGSEDIAHIISSTMKTEFDEDGAIAEGLGKQWVMVGEKAQEFADVVSSVIPGAYTKVLENGGVLVKTTTEQHQKLVEDIVSLYNGRLAPGAIEALTRINMQSERVTRMMADGWVTATELAALGIQNMGNISAEQFARMVSGAQAVAGQIGGIVGAASAATAAVNAIPSMPAVPNTNPLPGFASGGEFTVGGRPGVDTNLVAFRASMGETVTITPPAAASSNARDTRLLQAILNTLTRQGADLARLANR